MSYFEVLCVFIIPPLLILAVLLLLREWSALKRRGSRNSILPYGILLAHVLIALIYTTPWDNYLVATRVWWYDPELVNGMTIGWVPIEEYMFFILQTMLTGFWFLGLRFYRFPDASVQGDGRQTRLQAFSIISLLWIASVVFLLSGWDPLRYIGLILVWALPPILLQMAFGADILLANWRIATVAILPSTIYLWLVDSLAIQQGTWVINPEQTIGIKMGSLPLEEMVFFLMTNVLIGSGLTLMLSTASQLRAKQWWAQAGRKLSVIRREIHIEV